MTTAEDIEKAIEQHVGWVERSDTHQSLFML